MPATSYQRLPQSLEGEERKQCSAIWQHIWRGTNAVMVVFFLLAAYFQINDPDPYVWIPVYLVPALLSMAVCVYPQSTGSAVWQIIAVVHFSICLSGALYLIIVVVGLLMNKGINNPLVHEEGRELGGVFIICLWLALSHFSGNSSSGSGKSLLLVTVVLSICPLAFWGMCYIDSLQHLGHCTDMFGGKSIEL